jgi:sulfonate transport system substrate-binding protein
LKGKKVAVTKGAGSHFLLLAALRKAGLTSKSVEVAYLAPADGRAACEKGAVDAWVTWDPFVAAIEAQSKVRRLPDAEGIANYQRYYLASASFARDRKDALAAIFEQLKSTGVWVKQNPTDAAKLLAPIWGIPEAVVATANGRRSYDVRAVTPTDLGEQQTIADVFFAEGLLPRAVKAADAASFNIG